MSRLVRTQQDESVDARIRAAVILASQLVVQMPGWAAVTPTEDGRVWTAMIRRADGAAVTIDVGGHHARDRVTFRPTWPEYQDRRQYSTPARPCRHPKTHPDLKACAECMHHSHETWPITVSRGRSPAAIAKEIQRRLLPDYLPAYVEAVKDVQRVNGHTDEALFVARRLATVVKGLVQTTSYRTGERVDVRAPSPSLHRIEVSPQYDSVLGGQPVRVSFRVHDLDPETAAHVLDVIRAASDREDAVKTVVRAASAESAVEMDEEIANVTTEGRRMRVGEDR